MAKATTRLSEKAKYVKYGYGQVEGNKLSARYNGKIFAQLPCEADLTVVENGMFLVYDYAKKLVTKPGSKPVMEPMLVFNEVKVYDNFETDADFAMLADKYEARVYNASGDGVYAHYLNGETLTEYDNVTEMNDGESKNLNPYGLMRNGADEEDHKSNSIVPRLLKTDIGDIMTTNTIAEDAGSLNVGDTLKVGEDGYLSKSGTYEGMEWQVVKVYNMPDLQPGVKIMRIK